jgi:spermidine/putrescine transport system permease protein
MTRLNFKWAFVLGIVFIYLPVLILVIYSFNDSRFAVTWQGFTFKWYLLLWEKPEVIRAVRNTLWIAFSSTFVATILGTLLAFGLKLYPFPGKKFIQPLMLLPIIIPDIIMAISLLAFYVFLNFSLGQLSIILAHITFQIAYVALVVGSRFQDFPDNIIEAAQDLGAGQKDIIVKILLPLTKPAILAGALIAFTLSVDDFLITYFTAGAGSSTLPIQIYSMVKRGVTPDINALSTLILLVTLLLLYLGISLQKGTISKKVMRPDNLAD